MKTYFRLLLMVAMLLSIHITVEAGPGRMRPNTRKIMKKLDLTPEQKTQLKEIRQKNKPLMMAAHEKVREASEKLDAAFTLGSSDAELTAKHKDVMLALNARGSQRFSSMLEVRNILNEEQKVKYDKIMSEMKERRRAKKRKRMRFMQERMEEEGGEE